MPLLQLDNGVGALAAGDIIVQAKFCVQIKATWAGAWVNEPYIEPLNATDCVAPGIGVARFKFSYGYQTREDRPAWAQEYDKELRDYYIRVLKITEDGVNVKWTGIVDAETLVAGGGANPSGREWFEALGLVHLLDRDAIDTVLAKDGSGAIVEIDAAYACNRRGLRTHEFARVPAPLGNRSSAKHTDGAYVFSADADLWSARDAAEMVLIRYAPAGGPAFTLAGAVEVLAQFKSIVELKNRTPWNVLNDLISPKRGLGFAPVVTGAGVTLFVFSVLESAVSAGGVTIPANTQQIELQLDSGLDLQAPQLTWTTATRYEEFEARGAPALACFTLAYSDSTLEKGWSTALRTAYGTAAGTVPDDNDAFRNADRFADVFTKHRLPKDWDGRTANGAGGTKAPALPQFDDAGELVLATGAPFVALDKHFERYIPLRESLNYAVNPPGTTELLAGAEEVYRVPFALIKDPAASAWHYVEKLRDTDIEDAQAHFGIYPRDLAVKVEGQPRYAYGLNDFAYPADAEGNYDPVVDYNTLIVTVAMRTDQSPRVVMQADDYVAGGLKRRKVIDAPWCEFWYIAPNTVVDVGSSLAASLYAGTGILRDDRQRLREIVAAMKAWYGVDRAAATLPYQHRIDAPAPLGALVLGAATGQYRREINSVVSSIGMNFQKPLGVTIQTQWAELDFASIGGAQ
jgi:hypothetical protein